jgi:hypothetical protein
VFLVAVYIQRFEFVDILLLVELLPFALVVLGSLHEFSRAGLALGLVVCSTHSDDLVVDAFFHGVPRLAGFVEETEALFLDAVEGALGGLNNGRCRGCRSSIVLGSCGAGGELYIRGLVDGSLVGRVGLCLYVDGGGFVFEEAGSDGVAFGLQGVDHGGEAEHAAHFRALEDVDLDYTHDTGCAEPDVQGGGEPGGGDQDNTREYVEEERSHGLGHGSAGLTAHAHDHVQSTAHDGREKEVRVCLSKVGDPEETASLEARDREVGHGTQQTESAETEDTLNDTGDQHAESADAGGLVDLHHFLAHGHCSDSVAGSHGIHHLCVHGLCDGLHCAHLGAVLACFHEHGNQGQTVEESSCGNGTPPRQTRQDMDVFQGPFNNGSGTPTVVQTEILQEAESLGNVGIIGSIGDVKRVAVRCQSIGRRCGWRSVRSGREGGSCGRC